MQTDRSTKLLLFAIASALWLGLLRSFFAPVPSQAQQPATGTAEKPLAVDITAVGGQPVRAGLPIMGLGGGPVQVQTERERTQVIIRR